MEPVDQRVPAQSTRETRTVHSEELEETTAPSVGDVVIVKTEDKREVTAGNHREFSRWK